MRRTEVIKLLIEESGLSVKAFSEKIGLPYSTLRSMLERGIGNASVDNVIKVCKGLGVTFEQIEQIAYSNLQEEKLDLATPIAAHLKGKDISKEKLRRIEKFIEFTLNEEE